MCKKCGGSGIFEHGRQRDYRKECDPAGHLRSPVSNRIRAALRSGRSQEYLAYLSCAIAYLGAHLELRFGSLSNDGMSWENCGEWEIDHQTPGSRQSVSHG
jgi:hypothetical protein